MDFSLHRSQMSQMSSLIAVGEAINCFLLRRHLRGKRVVYPVRLLDNRVEFLSRLNIVVSKGTRGTRCDCD